VQRVAAAYKVQACATDVEATVRSLMI